MAPYSREEPLEILNVPHKYCSVIHYGGKIFLRTLHVYFYYIPYAWLLAVTLSGCFHCQLYLSSIRYIRLWWSRAHPDSFFNCTLHVFGIHLYGVHSYTQLFLSTSFFNYSVYMCMAYNRPLKDRDFKSPTLHLYIFTLAASKLSIHFTAMLKRPYKRMEKL